MTFQYVHGLQDAIADFLTNTLRRRRLRDEYLSEDLLCDPAWDMMLDLYLSERLGREVMVTSLCLASRAPATTALRWIAKLERERLVYRQPTPNDRRSSRMLLTDKGRAAMEGWARKAMRPPTAAEFDLHGTFG